MGAGCKPSKSSSGVFPPARLHLLKVSQPNQTLPLAEEQVFKRTVDTDIQTTVASVVAWYCSYCLLARTLQSQQCLVGTCPFCHMTWEFKFIPCSSLHEDVLLEQSDVAAILLRLTSMGAYVGVLKFGFWKGTLSNLGHQEDKPSVPEDVWSSLCATLVNVSLAKIRHTPPCLELWRSVMVSVGTNLSHFYLECQGASLLRGV